MTKKHAVGLTSLFATAALLTLSAPAGAMSPPHYFEDGLGNVARILGGEVRSVDEWGTLALTNLTTGGQVTCHNVIGGVVENPIPGGSAGPAGVGETQAFEPYECESAACTASATGGGPATYISLFAEGSAVPRPNTGTGTMTGPGSSSEEPLAASGTNLRWKNVLIFNGTKIQQESIAVRLNVICHVETGANINGPEFGVQIPELYTGNFKPSETVHCCTALAPPELVFDSPGSGVLQNMQGQQGKLEGALKIRGYNNQETINAKAG